MKIRGTRVLLCVLCLGLATTVAAQDRAPSVMERVQKVEDPDLGELIRAALEKRPSAHEPETRELIRKVTLRYTQIKLLDRQIEQVAHKLEATTGPVEMLRADARAGRAGSEAGAGTSGSEGRDGCDPQVSV